jgi:hypothetical protein
MAANGRRREAVALCLASGSGVRDAAKEAGCGERTVHRWLAEDPAFRRRVDDLAAELFSQAVGKLSRLAGQAADTMGELLTAKNESVRLQAAKAVLECGLKVREMLVLTRDLEDLKKQIEAQGQPSWCQPTPEGN